MGAATVQDRITTTHVGLMLHDRLNILFVTNVHEATRRQAVFDDNVEEEFDRRHLKASCKVGDSLTRITSK
jgi:hypothetical protein